MQLKMCLLAGFVILIGVGGCVSNGPPSNRPKLGVGEISATDFRLKISAPELSSNEVTYFRESNFLDEMKEFASWREGGTGFEVAYLGLRKYEGTKYYLGKQGVQETLLKNIPPFSLAAKVESGDMIIDSRQGVTRYRRYTYEQRECVGFQRVFTANRSTPDHAAGDSRLYGYYCAPETVKLGDAMIDDIIQSITYKGRVFR